MSETYDLAIIGGGPAGLTAGIYGARAGLSTIILEKLTPGGQVVTTDVVENYPGFTEPITGYELMEKMLNQASKFGVEIKSADVKSLDINHNDNEIHAVFDDGKTNALSVIIASGAEHRRLDIPGENRFWGSGVSCCATCDGMFYRDKEVVVVGGGDTAIKESIFLTKFASKITIIHRRDRLRATKVLQDEIFKMGDKVNFAWKTVVKEVMGDAHVEAVRLENVDTNEERILECDGVFVFVGFNPNTEFARGVVDTDKKGYIITNDDMATSVPGIYACGDARKKLLRQIITACGEGATAAYSAQMYVEELKGIAYK
ncbi:thioredoxin-disulfide reductase [Candidatus Poribacteria bacterium]|nr:thioredoxin-disulfide reductase [Candidatus Poribacteria bacterium]